MTVSTMHHHSDQYLDCLDIILQHEGGYVDDPHDSGGATNRGITLQTYRRFHPHASKADLQRITEEEVAEIYWQDYWAPGLPAGLDLAVFDYGVNSGRSRAVKELQRQLGVPEDGICGKITAERARHEATMGRSDDLIHMVCFHRLAFYKRLKVWKYYGKGWTNRINDTEARSKEMAKGAVT